MCGSVEFEKSQKFSSKKRGFLPAEGGGNYAQNNIHNIFVYPNIFRYRLIV